MGASLQANGVALNWFHTYVRKVVASRHFQWVLFVFNRIEITDLSGYKAI